MSRRKRRTADGSPRRGREGAGGAGARSGRGTATDGAGASGRRAPRGSSRRIALDVALLIAVFALATGIAELAGAANLGVALGVGQVVFAIALVALLLRE